MRFPLHRPAARARLVRPLLVVIFCALALYPWLYSRYLTTVLTQWLPNTSTAFVIVAFTVMGLGLNFVVGYAGLRRVEVANLITLSEGIRTGVAADAIRPRLMPRTDLESAHV